MNFEHTDKAKEMLARLERFMDKYIYPNEKTYDEQMKAFRDAGDPWQVPQILEDLKPKAQEEGLWNLFLPESERGGGLTNVEYAALCEIMGRVGWSSEVFNCSAPDTGNMEVIERYGNERQKKEYLEPLLEGKMRSAFLMTEPAVASSDATNIATRIERDGDEYVINGRKWWSSGVGDPRCKIAIVMGKTDPKADTYRQQSQILMPLDAPGVKVVRMLPVFGYDDAPHGHAEVILDNVRVPAENLLLGEGRGFEISQGRLKAAYMMDTVGNKVARTEIAMIKVAAPRMALKVIDDAIQAHGGGGVTSDFGLARMYSGIRTLRLADGPDEVHNRTIARLEFKKYMNKARAAAE
jgi:alkylation response protein AidB-like acyl-CoA dehydrogenase